MGWFTRRKSYQLLEGAAHRIEHRGRAIGRLEDTDGSVCILGALGVEAYGDSQNMGGEVRRASDAMKKSGVTGGHEPWVFNDENRDDKKVVRAIRDAAMIARQDEIDEFKRERKWETALRLHRERVQAARSAGPFSITDSMRSAWADEAARMEEMNADPQGEWDADDAHTRNPLGVSTGPS